MTEIFITPVKLGHRFTGRVKLAFYQDDPDDDRHKHSGWCGCFWGWFDRIMTKLTLYWISEEGYDYGHVEMMFSDGTVVSATENGGVHVLKDKLLSNEGYTRVISVKVSPAAEKRMLETAKEFQGVPFNRLGRVWNNVSVLKSIVVVDLEKKGFYCSELVTHLLQIGAAHDGLDMCAGLDYRTTNPTQLYLNLTKTNYGKLDWNEKEARAHGIDERKPSGFLSTYLYGGRSKKKREKLTSIKIV